MILIPFESELSKHEMIELNMKDYSIDTNPYLFIHNN